MTEICVWSVGLMILTVEIRGTRIRNLSQRNFFHQNSHMDWPETEPGLRRCETGNETAVMHHLQHTNRAGHEMVAELCSPCSHKIQQLIFLVSVRVRRDLPQCSVRLVCVFLILISLRTFLKRNNTASLSLSSSICLYIQYKQ